MFTFTWIWALRVQRSCVTQLVFVSAMTKKTETTSKSVDIGLDSLNGPIFLICNYIIPLVHGKQL